jgi:hypothetical protein
MVRIEVGSACERQRPMTIDPMSPAQRVPPAMPNFFEVVSHLADATDPMHDLHLERATRVMSRFENSAAAAKSHTRNA